MINSDVSRPRKVATPEECWKMDFGQGAKGRFFIYDKNDLQKESSSWTNQSCAASMRKSRAKMSRRRIGTRWATVASMALETTSIVQ